MADQPVRRGAGSLTDRRPKVVVTDLDGTLLRSDGSVSDRTVAALARVEAAGAMPVIATGRPLRWIRPLADRLGHRGLAICSNGALVYDLSTERVVEQFPLTIDVCRDLVVALRRAIDGVSFAVERDDTLVCEPTYPAVRLEPDPHRVVAADLAALLAAGPVKLLVRHETYAGDDLLARARMVVGELAELTHSAGSGPVEISARGVSKASALALLCERHGVAAAEVVAFGDMPNDLPMLAWAGRSYAVSNAHPDVLALVDHRCARNDDDGVAEVLEKLYG